MLYQALRMSLTAAVLFALAPSAHAATRYVAVNGVDGPGCGLKINPCRSITRAVQSAAAGDRIIVGPGTYGDINHDGDVSDPGEETGVPFCGCVLGVDRAVTVTSSDGAAATVIDATNVEAPRNVLIITNGARFGMPGKGFTVTPTFSDTNDGILILGADNAVAGNLLAGATPRIFLGTGIEVADTAPGPILIEGNLVSEWFHGIVARGKTTVRKNQVSRNTRIQDGVGIVADGSDAVAVGNVAIGNDVGFDLRTAASVVGNAALGNVGSGFIVRSQFAGVFAKNNVLGNGKFIDSNCGMYNDRVGLLAANNYWGAATGPGGDPADTICNESGGTATVTPFATKPFKVKAPIKP
jgi:hypothetical protein